MSTLKKTPKLSMKEIEDTQDFLSIPNPEKEGTESEENDVEEEEEESSPEPEPKTKRPKSHQVEEPNSPTPTARTIRGDGKYIGRSQVELQGLSSQMLPPMMKNRYAEYETINRGQVDPLTDQLNEPTSLILPGKYTVYDPFEKEVMKRHKTIKNVTRHETVNRGGVNMSEEVVDDIVFDTVNLKVPIEKNYLMYVLLELHPLNESNPRRDKSQAPAFRRIDVNVRKWSGAQNNQDLAFDAESQVVNMKDVDTIIRWATAAGIHTAGRQMDNGPGTVKHDLRIFARNNPKDFFALDPRNDSAVKIAVMDSIDLGIIEYTPDNRMWRFFGSGEMICQHLPQDEPTEYLIKSLRKKEYEAAYKELQQLLNYWD